jgi:hypothetical protein
LGFRFFWVSGTPTGEKQNPHPNSVLRGLGSDSSHRCKNAPKLAPSGIKPTDYPKHEPELPYLTAPLPPIASNFKLFAIIGLQGIGFSIALEPALLPNSIIFS